MPLYEYQCKSCAHRFERIRKFSDPPLQECPQCGKASVEQMISAPAVQFKGSGWYVTDYANKHTAPSTSSSSSQSSSENSSATVSAGKDSGGSSPTAGAVASTSGGDSTGGSKSSASNDGK